MNLHRLLQQRITAGGPPVRVGLIGAGKFGSMFLSQVPTIRGLEVAVIADLDPDRARLACHRVGWDAALNSRPADSLELREDHPCSYSAPPTAWSG